MVPDPDQVSGGEAGQEKRQAAKVLEKEIQMQAAEIKKSDASSTNKKFRCKQHK